MELLVRADVKQGKTGWDLLQFTTPAKELRTKPGDGVPRQQVVGGRPLHLLLTNSVQPVKSHGFKSSPHHGILFQYFVEVVHREGVEPAVGISSHAGCAPPTGQQANFCKERPSLRTRG